jgi:hypothetical protein
MGIDTEKTTEPDRKRRWESSEKSKRIFPYFGSVSLPTIVPYSHTSNPGRLATVALHDRQLEASIAQNGENPLHLPRRQTGFHAGDVGAIDPDLLGNVGLRRSLRPPDLGKGTA